MKDEGLIDLRMITKPLMPQKLIICLNSQTPKLLNSKNHMSKLPDSQTPKLLKIYFLCQFLMVYCTTPQMVSSSSAVILMTGNLSLAGTKLIYPSS